MGTLFKQEWMTKVNGTQLLSGYIKPAKALRVAQFNVLSHGQTNVGCGFSPLFKGEVGGKPLSSCSITSYVKDVKAAIQKKDFKNEILKKILDPKNLEKLLKKNKTTETDIKNQWADAKKRYEGKKLGENYEIMTSEEAKWIHS